MRRGLAQTEPIPLNDNDRAELVDAKAGRPSEEVRMFDDLQLTKADLRALDPQRRPRRAVISAYCKMIAEKYPHVCFLEGQYQEILSDLHPDMDPKECRRRALGNRCGPRSSVFTHLLLPVYHRATDHWCLVVADKGRQTLLLCDAGPSNPRRARIIADAKSLLTKVVPDSCGFWFHRVLPTPELASSCDAAVFTMHCALHLTLGLPLEFGQADMTALRQRTQLELIAGELLKRKKVEITYGRPQADSQEDEDEDEGLGVASNRQWMSTRGHGSKTQFVPPASSSSSSSSGSTSSDEWIEVEDVE